jgi:hypothetical protein
MLQYLKSWYLSVIAGDSVDYINKTRGNQTRRHQGPIYYIGSTRIYQVPEAVDRNPDQTVLPSPANWAQKCLPPLAIVLILWWNDMIALSSSGPDQMVIFLRTKIWLLILVRILWGWQNIMIFPVCLVSAFHTWLKIFFSERLHDLHISN